MNQKLPLQYFVHTSNNAKSNKNCEVIKFDNSHFNTSNYFASQSYACIKKISNKNFGITFKMNTFILPSLRFIRVNHAISIASHEICRAVK